MMVSIESRGMGALARPADQGAAEESLNTPSQSTLLSLSPTPRECSDSETSPPRNPPAPTHSPQSRKFPPLRTANQSCFFLPAETVLPPPQTRGDRLHKAVGILSPCAEP